MHQRGDEEEDPGKVPFKVPLQERRGRSDMEIEKKSSGGWTIKCIPKERRKEDPAHFIVKREEGRQFAPNKRKGEV